MNLDALCPWPRKMIAAFTLVTAIYRGAGADVSLAPISSIREIRSLSASEAVHGIPCAVSGVVTLVGEGSHAVVIQSGDCGIWLGGKTPVAQPGQRLLVRGKTQAGEFAPVLDIEESELLGDGTTEQPFEAQMADLESGSLDCRLVSVSGLVWRVEAVHLNGLDYVHLYLHLGSGSPLVIAGQDWNREEAAAAFLDAKIRATGVVVHGFTDAGQVRRSIVRVNAVADVSILEPPVGESAAPQTTIDGLLGYRPDLDWRHRVRLRGVVTGFGQDGWTALQSEGRGLLVWVAAGDRFAPGDIVEALGFAEPGAYSPVLREARLTRLGAGPGAQPAEIDWKTPGILDARLVHGNGTLVGLSLRSDSAIVLVREHERIFEARLAGTMPAEWKTAAPGASVSVTGICIAERESPRDEGVLWRPQTFWLQMREPSDFRVIAPGPWWTRERLAIAIGFAGVALSLAAAGIAALARRNRRLARTEATLIGTRDRLEERVSTRTEQLSEQVRARREQQAVFAALNVERNRLARDLHDTVQQRLASAALRLETMALDLPGKTRGEALKLAVILQDGQEEVRRSVWALRAMALDRHTLAAAMRENLELLLDGSGLAFDFHADGAEGDFPDAIADGLLRILHEAVSNVLKHAHATHLSAGLVLEGGNLVLAIEDDGCGLKPGEIPRGCGLAGMAERAKLLGGEFTIHSQPGSGTVLRVALPSMAVQPETFDV